MSSHKKSLVPSVNDTNSEFPFENHSAQPLANNLWVFFSKVFHFCKVPFFVGAIFVYFRRSVCHVPLFSNSIQIVFSAGCHFLFGVSDDAVFVFYSYVHKGIFRWVVKL